MPMQNAFSRQKSYNPKEIMFGTNDPNFSKMRLTILNNEMVKDKNDKTNPITKVNKLF
ncbi:MAG: hypothetical protein CM15mP31_4860 [Gammaproteobacteria bacterium]|nr:MAG: hypothetical protein CM15mP31_4860 [Gammaproteobacteria bacterium]